MRISRLLFFWPAFQLGHLHLHPTILEENLRSFGICSARKKHWKGHDFQPIALFQFPSSSSFIKSISKYTLSLIKCLLQQIDNSIVVTSQSHQTFSCLRALFQDEIINIHFCGAPVRHLLNAFLGFPKQGLGGMRDPPKNGQSWLVETV